MNHLPPRLRHWLAIAATALLLAACGGGGGSSSGSDTVTSQGTVVDDQGIPLSGATIKVIAASAGTASTSSASDGTFSIPLSSGTAGVIRVEKAGFTPMVRAAGNAASNAAFAARVVLLPVASTQNFDSTQAAVLRVPGSSARVELAASSLVRTDGQAISGSATVQLTPIDPSKDISHMPGVMVDANSGTPIESLGALSVNFTDASGAPLNLASGQTATIRIPATPAAGATLPATFPLYHLNETTGLWEQEGTATLQTDPVTGDKYYEGTVSHFSTWNADQVITRSSLDIGATQGGMACQVPAGARVVALGVDYNGMSDAGGNNVFVRQNSQVELRLLDVDGNVMDAVQLTSGSAGNTLRLPRCLSTPSALTLSGRVTVTSGVLSNYRVQISGTRMQTTTVAIANDGSYSTRVYGNLGTVQAQLVSSVDRGTPDTQVTTTVATVDTSFPDLTVQDTRFNLSGCVQGWSSYRQTSAQVSLFRGTTQIGQPQKVQSSSPNFTLMDLPFNTTLTLRLTAPDATLAEKTATIVVGGTPATLGSCLELPKAATAQLQLSGTGLNRSFDASGSVAGDAAITSYAWTFGDGSTGIGATASHSYATDGNYLITLTLTDALGQVSQASTTETVAASVNTLATALSVGANHSCALTSAGGVKCWGSNDSGQLGNGSTTDSRTPVQVSGLASGVVAISAGAGHSCALTSAGALKCWGYNSSGALGDGTTTGSTTPVDVSGLGSGVIAMSAGFTHTCALTSAGGVKCWGLNYNGEVGNGSALDGIEPVTAPVDVIGLGSGALAVRAGHLHTCALTSAGGVKCWGDNNARQLGNGSTTRSSTPVDVAGLASVAAIGVGGYGFENLSCALTSAGGIKCWGANENGQLGNGSAVPVSGTPVDVSGLGSGVAAIGLGLGRHVCALTSTGAVKCWGGNTAGQLGNGTTTVSKVPVDVSGLGSGAVAIGVGEVHSCALTSAGGVKCWGSNFKGQLGTGGSTNSSTPVAVVGFP